MSLVGCVTIPALPKPGALPTVKPGVADYYNQVGSYQSARETSFIEKREYFVRRIELLTKHGLATVDYYQQKTPNNHLVLLFPALGGKNIIETHFAKTLAKSGIDCAIVHRVNDFKSPDNFNRLEEILRATTIKDRIIIDYFEENYHKTQFGAFGLSRGGINVAITAGVDARLRHNVLALAGSDIIEIFRGSDKKRLENFKEAVKKAQNYSESEFFDALERMIKTDPKYLAQNIDPNHTVLILSVFDFTVPLQQGMLLREQMNYPKTIFLLAGHYTALLYTNFVKVFPPVIEDELISFYKDEFGVTPACFASSPLRFLRLPIDFLALLLATIIN